MKPKVSLRNKVLVLAVINAVLLVVILTAFTKTQLTQDIGSLLLGESRARITAVAMQLGRELPNVASKDQTALLNRYSAEHGVGFYFFRLNGMQLAGANVELPAEVTQYVAVMREKAPLAVLEGISRRTDAPAPPVLRQQEMDSLLTVVQDVPFFVRARGYWVVLRLPIRSNDSPGFIPGFLIMKSESFVGTPFFFNLTPWLGLGTALIVLALGCWLPLVRGATKSIATLSAATAQIANGKFSNKVSIKRSDELGQLGDSFNRMASQLEGHVNGQKRFLRDAAHELRSPLARMQAALGNVLESNPGADSQPFLDDLREEIDLMSSLTGELLTFAREENQQGRLKLAPVNLSDVAARVLTTENPTGAADVRMHIDKEWIVTAHSESLFRGLSNVVRNAIRYAGGEGPITLAAERQNGSTVVTVSDKGPGIPEESLEMIFTPFYRLDVSRNRNTGGNGLGMAIARSCIESCKGTIRCRNGRPGLEVIITLGNSEG